MGGRSSQVKKTLLSGALGRLWRLARNDGDRLGRLRRYAEMRLDQSWTLVRWKLGPRPSVVPYDGVPRFGLLTVNFSTTRYLKLMLLTLCDQLELSKVYRLIIVDNDSRDGGVPFLQALDARVECLHLVRCRIFPNHGRGLRQSVAFLDRVEEACPTKERANLLLCCDTDIIFRNPHTLSDVASTITSQEAAFAGELRLGAFPWPEAQASFFALRRDCYARPDVVPFVNHGAPAYWMQRSLWRAGLHLADFPSNRGGYILHRGRTAVAAARRFRRLSARATTPNFAPHYMGVPGGEEIWKRMEQRHGEWLEPAREAELVDHLSERLSILGRG